MTRAAAPLPEAVDRARSRDFRQLRRLAAYLAPYRWRVAGALVALVVAAAAVLSLGIGLRYLIDSGFGAGRPQALDHALRASLIVILALAIATYLRSYLVTWLGERVVAELRAQVYRHIIRMPPGFFETTRTGEVLSRLTTDTTVVQTVIGSTVTQALRNILLTVGGVGLLVYSNPKLAGLVLLVVPLVVVPIVVFGRMVRRLSRTAQDRLADVSGRAEETVNAVRTVQAFAQEGRESVAFAAASEAAFQAAAARARARSMLAAVVITLVFGAIVAVLWMGGQDVLAGRISAGELSAFVFFATVVASAGGGLSDIVGDLQRPPAPPSGCSSCSTASRPSRRRRSPWRCRRGPPARCASSRSASPIRAIPSAPSSIASTSPSAPARASPWSARPAPARRASSSSSCASTTRRKGASASTASPSTGSTRPVPCAPRPRAAGAGDLLGRCLGQHPLRPARRPATRRSSRRPRRRRRAASSRRCRRALPPSSARRGSASPVGSASASPSPGPSSAIPPCSCSTRRPARSMPKASSPSSRRSTT
ncbi:MAG: ABC transporter transmembrane domain-containing protein [Geminicoccaceae bacterium]